MPEVSVIVPVYNVEGYVRRCIESILAQEFKDYELILVNDGSTDNSGAICHEYAQKDPRITVVDKANGGLSDARNAGIAMARGTYFSFIDSDDFVEPDLLSRCVQKFHEEHCDMVIFDFYQYYTATNSREVMKNVFAPDRVYNLATEPDLIVKIANAAWNKMYRRELFMDSGIRYPWGCYYEDLGTTYRLLARCRKICFVDAPLYNYLQDRPGNITGDFNMKSYHVLDMVKITLDDYRDLGIYERYYEQLKFLGSVNILECLKKTRTCTDRAMVEKFIDVCFFDIHNTWPEFPRCKYRILREKNDWIYADPGILKLYLRLRRRRK